MGLPRFRHLSIVVRSESARCGSAALPSQDRRCAGTMLLQEIIGQAKRSSQTLSATGRAILGKVWSGFQGEACIGDQTAEGFEGCAVDWHTFIVRQVWRKSNR